MQKILIILVLCYSSIPLSASDDSTNVRILDTESNQAIHSKLNTLHYSSLFDRLHYKSLSLIYEQVLNSDNELRNFDFTIGGGVATGIPYFITNSVNLYFGFAQIGSNKYFINIGYIKQFFDIEKGVIDFFGYDDFNHLKEKGALQNQIYTEFGYKFVPSSNEDSHFSYTFSSSICMDINGINGNIIIIPFHLSKNPIVYPITLLLTLRFTIGYSW